MSGQLLDRARFLLRQDNLATVITKISPPERTALEGIIRLIVRHMEYCESHGVYYLDHQQLSANEDVALYLFPEELDALSLVMMKVAEKPSV